MASFFTNAFNTVTSGIGSGINYVSNSGVGHFFGSVLNSGSNFLAGLSNLPASFTGLVNGISNNSTLFLIAVVLIGGAVIFSDFKSSSSSYSSRYS